MTMVWVSSAASALKDNETGNAPPAATAAAASITVRRVIFNLSPSVIALPPVRARTSSSAPISILWSDHYGLTIRHCRHGRQARDRHGPALASLLKSSRLYEQDEEESAPHNE